MGQPHTRRFYRVAHECPPGERDYTTAREKRKGKPPPPYVPPELHRSWNEGLSAYDNVAGAQAQARALGGRIGWILVAYDLPVGGPIQWEPHPGDEASGHHDLYGDREVLKTFLVPDYCEPIDHD